MPRKSNSDSPAPRRVSARIAAAVSTKPPTTPSPTKRTTPKRTKKAAAKEVEEKDTSEINGTDQLSNDASLTEDITEPIVKKQKTDDSEVGVEPKLEEAISTEAMAVDATAAESKVHEDAEKSEPIPEVHSETDIIHEKITEPKPMVKETGNVPEHSSEVETNVPVEPVAAVQTATVPEKNSVAHITEPGFEVIEKSTIPSSDSEEVKAAITAQGEDGELLVNFVQVAKDEVPAPEDIVPELKVQSPEQHRETNGVETSISLHGDNGADQISQSPKKVNEIAHDKVQAIVPPQQDMHAEL